MLEKRESINSWDLIIRPDKKFSLKKLIEEIFHFRDLLFMLVKRDFISFYKQTIFGPLWFFIQPVFTTIVYTFIFGNLAGLSTDGIPKPLFYLSGITLWNYFADCLTKTSSVFRDNSQIFGKVYFPRFITPLSIVISNLVKFFVQFLLLITLIIFFKIKGAEIHITYFALFFPVYIFFMALLGLGLGSLITAATIKYRDLSFLVVFGVQLLMYATTVIYPLSSAPEELRTLIALNPMTWVVELFRLGFLGQGEFSGPYVMLSILSTLVVFFLGLYVFNRSERNFIDKI